MKRTAEDVKLAARDAGAVIRRGAADAGSEQKKIGNRRWKAGQDVENDVKGKDSGQIKRPG